MRRKVGDLVLMHHMGKPVVYAKIEGIEPDPKEGWYQVDLLILTVPAQKVKWILREEYIDGATFTMGGVPIRLGEVEIADLKEMLESTEQNKKPSKKQTTTKAKVISLKRN